MIKVLLFFALSGVLLFSSLRVGTASPLNTVKPDSATGQTDEVSRVIDWTNAMQEQTDSEFEQLSRFVRRIFQDRQGNLWFGTNGDGVIRFDGESLEYFAREQGFSGVAVRAIVEDQEGQVWFGTEGGITRYDGEKFTNYTTADGLPHNSVWSMTVDDRGEVWIGTLGGACRFDGQSFKPFELPKAEPDLARGVTSEWIVHCIMQDSQNRIWLTTNGGVYIYDRETNPDADLEKLTHISVDDGLCHNSVVDIEETDDGTFWFSTFHNGVCSWNGTSFTHYSAAEGVIGTEAWSVFKDGQGNIWFPIENSGLYRYDGTSFSNFQEAQGLTTNAVQCVFEDREGRIWIGGWQGLFRLQGESIIPVGKQGPWK